MIPWRTALQSSLFNTYNVQPYAFIDARVASSWVLHAAARVPRVCGLSANFFHCARQVVTAFLNCAREASGTLLETQVS